jgi:hypothetical protein
MKKKWEYNGRVHQLFINIKKVYDSDRKKVLYSILGVLGTHAISQAD